MARRFTPFIRVLKQSRLGPRFPVGLCLQQVRGLYGIGPRDGSAIAAWQAAEHKHPETDPRKIPRGVPVFWSGGSQGYGHIALATGWGGRCWSPDTLRAGYFDRVGIDQVTDWITNGRLLGWTEDLNGVRLYSEGKTP